MKLLKKTFERASMKSVVTYINSGNILFTQDSLSKLEVSHILEEAIQKDFGLQIKVLIRAIDEFNIIINNLRESWKNNQYMKSNVMFFWDEIDDKSVNDKLQIKPGIDYVKYVTGAILWSVDTLIMFMLRGVLFVHQEFSFYHKILIYFLITFGGYVASSVVLIGRFAMGK